MTNRTILISGASVAGPALAFWLSRYGWSPTIVERAPQPRSGGQAIDVRGAARAVVERMGLMDQVRQAHTGVRGMYMVNSAGKPQVSMGAEAMNGSGGLIAEIEILRGDLVHILHEATHDDVEYLFDDSISGVAEHRLGVEVTFERSAPRHYDLVVGADGLHSNVRAKVFGDESQFVQELGCYVAVFSTPNLYHLSDRELWFSIPGKHGLSGKSVLLYPARHGSEARAMLYFASPNVHVDRHDIAQQKQLVANEFAHQTWEIPQVLQAMQTATEFYGDQVALVQLARWSHGRVALLGDAAYCPSPMSGMGTSLALLGAYVLAGELATTRPDAYTEAFTSYQQQMEDAVRRAQKFARDAHMSLLPRSPYQLWMVQQVMRMMTHWPFKGLATSDAEKAANAVPLKEYGAPCRATPTNPMGLVGVTTEPEKGTPPVPERPL